MSVCASRGELLAAWVCAALLLCLRSLQDEINIIGVAVRPMVDEFIECIQRQEKGQDFTVLLGRAV